METLSGVTAQSMADELPNHAKVLLLDNTAAGLTNIPRLVLTSDDGDTLAMDAFVAAIKAKGGSKVTAEHVATDHVWADRRIALESAISNWLTAY
jgi:hypothetical protein